MMTQPSGTLVVPGCWSTASGTSRSIRSKRGTKCSCGGASATSSTRRSHPTTHRTGSRDRVAGNARAFPQTVINVDAFRVEETEQ